MLWLVPGLALTKSKINLGELTDKYPAIFHGDEIDHEFSQSARSDMTIKPQPVILRNF